MVDGGEFPMDSGWLVHFSGTWRKSCRHIPTCCWKILSCQKLCPASCCKKSRQTCILVVAKRPQSLRIKCGFDISTSYSVPPRFVQLAMTQKPLRHSRCGSWMVGATRRADVATTWGPTSCCLDPTVDATQLPRQLPRRPAAAKGPRSQPRSLGRTHRWSRSAGAPDRSTVESPRDSHGATVGMFSFYMFLLPAGWTNRFNQRISR